MLGANLTVDIEQEVTATGTEIHSYAAQMIREGEPPEISSEDPEMGFLASRVRKAWEVLKADIPRPQVEQPLSVKLQEFTILGHPDLYGAQIDEKGHAVVEIVDWKSGYKTDADVIPQLLGYAFLVMDGLKGKAKTFTVNLKAVWLRDNDIQEWSYTSTQIMEWMRSLHRRAGAWNGRDYTAGGHCQYCPRFHDCPARQALAKSAVGDLLDMSVEGFTRAQLAPRLPDLYAKVQMIDRQIAAFKTWLHDDLKQHGPLDCGDGKTISLGTRHKATIDVRKAWPILRGSLDDAELAECMSVSKTKLLAAVAKKSAPRMKGKDQAALMLAMEEGGAVTMRPEQYITWKAVKDEDDE